MVIGRAAALNRFSRSMAAMLGSLREVNLSGTGEPPADGRPQAAVKRSVAVAYDQVAEIMDRVETWNWGIADPEIAREIEALLPGWSRPGTDHYSEQLYFAVLRATGLTPQECVGKTFLEIGSGPGAGLNFLSRCLPETRFVGVDLSAAAVTRANDRYSRADRLRFVHGDAEDLPFGDAGFDVVINVESAHNYPDLTRFLREVTRVLRSGGVLSLTDLYTAQRRAQFAAAKQRNPGLTWVREQDVSDRVRAAISARMAPGSPLLTTLRSVPMPLLLKPFMMAPTLSTFGAEFAGFPNDGLAARVAKKLSGVAAMGDVPVVSYEQHVARKVETAP